MTEDEIAFRAAINVLRDSLESRRMPSGLPLDAGAAALHERAAQHLEALLRAPRPERKTRPRKAPHGTPD